MRTIKLGKYYTHLCIHSQWCFLAIKHTIAANVRSSENGGVFWGKYVLPHGRSAKQKQKYVLILLQ